MILHHQGGGDFDPIMRCTTNLIMIVIADKCKLFARLQYLAEHCQFVNPYAQDQDATNHAKAQAYINKASLHIQTVLLKDQEDFEIGLSKALEIIEQKKFIILTNEHIEEKSLPPGVERVNWTDIGGKKQEMAKLLTMANHTCYLLKEKESPNSCEMAGYNDKEQGCWIMNINQFKGNYINKSVFRILRIHDY